MIDFLIQIPGPLFLFYYLCYSAVVIYAVRFYIRRDYTAGYKVPEPTTFDPLDISILRDGVDGAIKFIVYKLWREKYFTFGNNSTIVTVPKKSSKELPSDPQYLEAYKIIRKSFSYKDLFDGEFKEFVEKKVAERSETLTKLKLLPDKRVVNHYWAGLILAEFLLLMTGGTKLVCGIYRHKPFFFLLILLLVSTFVAYKMFNPLKSRVKETALARKLLKITSQRFEYLLTVPSSALSLNEKDLLFGIAIFGITPLLGTYGSELYSFAELDKSLYKPANADSGMSYDSGSSCSGSGCSGGSGCGGGGCGGCGGD